MLSFNHSGISRTTLNDSGLEDFIQPQNDSIRMIKKNSRKTIVVEYYPNGGLKSQKITKYKKNGSGFKYKYTCWDEEGKVIEKSGGKRNMEEWCIQRPEMDQKEGRTSPSKKRMERLETKILASNGKK